MTNISALSSRVANAHQRIDGKVDKDGGILSGLTEFTSGVKLDNMSDPAAPSSGDVILYSSTNGTFRWINDAGLVGTVPQTQGNVQTFGSTGTGFSNVTAAWPIAGNDGNIGTVYRVKAWGKGTQGSTAQLCSWRLNIFGVTISTGYAATLLPANAGHYWDAEATAIIVTTGGGGSILTKLRANVSCVPRAGDATAPFLPFSFIGISASAQSADTTSSTTMFIDTAWGSTTGSPTMSGMASSFERIGS